MRPGLRSAVSSLLLSVACNPGGSTTGTASESGGSSTSAPTSGATDPTTTTGGASNGSSGSSGGASATGTGTTAEPTGSTGPVLTTSTETTTSAETTAAATGSTASETTGGEAMCGVANADYGDCAKPLGVAFDGEACRSLSGCDCGADCGLFFPSVAACAQACAGAGQCNPDIVEAVALAREPVQVGTHCDELDACPADEAQKAALLALFPEMVCEPGQFCDGTETCHLKFSGTIDAETWTQLCAASLVPGIEQLLCVVFGP